MIDTLVSVTNPLGQRMHTAAALEQHRSRVQWGCEGVSNCSGAHLLVRGSQMVPQLLSILLRRHSAPGERTQRAMCAVYRCAYIP